MALMLQNKSDAFEGEILQKSTEMENDIPNNWFHISISYFLAHLF